MPSTGVSQTCCGFACIFPDHITVNFYHLHVDCEQVRQAMSIMLESFSEWPFVIPASLDISP